MSNSAVKVLFTNKMVGLNKVVEKNDRGWYRVKFGEFNTYNSKNEFYLDTGLKELLEETDSYLSIKNRLESGYLKGEVTHPVREGHSDTEFVQRNLLIHGGFASHSIMKLEYVVTNKEVVAGYKVVELWAWIVPTENQHGQALKADLDNPDINIAFSIRCFSKVVYINGRMCRVITKIVTWDLIDIPGLKNSTKGGDIESITRESGLSDFLITGETLENLSTVLMNSEVTSESAGFLSVVNDLKDMMNPKEDNSIFSAW